MVVYLIVLLVVGVILATIVITLQERKLTNLRHALREKAVTVNLAKVCLFFKDENEPRSEHIVHFDDVNTMFEASWRLYRSYGINPYTKQEMPAISRIEVYELDTGNTYWWSHPHLETDSSGAARIYDWQLKATFELDDSNKPAIARYNHLQN